MANYYFFKEGIRPEWEDELNLKGGKWALQLSKSNRNSAPTSPSGVSNGPECDDKWLNTVLFQVNFTPPPIFFFLFFPLAY